MRHTFRQWSRLVDMGENGLAILSAWRCMFQASKAVQRQIGHDLIARGRSFTRISMGEDCTPIIQRIDPMEFYVHPAAESMDDMPTPTMTLTRDEIRRRFPFPDERQSDDT